MAMRATRHNGRSGKHGAYNPKHNDRSFDGENSEHINSEMSQFNVYWDCYQGYTLPNQIGNREYAFEQIEKAYYFNQYFDHVEAQNERNERGRHPERNRTTDDILKDARTCPEESLLQIGNIDGAVSASVLAKIAAEYFEEFEKRYGEHVHILDWALHLDEQTPHIHERHVFDTLNKYGELCPQQEKALEDLGFELPDSSKPKNKTNNRKMSFDAECRKLFIDIALQNGVELEVEPIYGGVSYLEKQDYIIKNQQKRIAEKEAILEGLVMKIDDVEAVVDEAVDLAYEKAVETITDVVKKETVNHDIEVVKDYGKWLESSNNGKDTKRIGADIINGVIKKLEKASAKFLKKLTEKFQEPATKKKAKEEIKERARISVSKRLAEKKEESKQLEAQKVKFPTKKHNIEL